MSRDSTPVGDKEAHDSGALRLASSQGNERVPERVRG